jgi:transposase InsO family protein
MAWSETTQMSRFRFVGDFESCLYEMTELCEKYGISRKTGYKWAERYGSEGAEGLKDRSRAPKRRPTQTPTEVTHRLVQLRRQHPTWGPRKLLAWLEKHEGERAWPAASTVGGILKREGLVLPSRRQRRDRPPSSAKIRTEATEANRVWTGDYKGQFRTGDGRLCYPLTLVDSFSRFVLVIHGFASVAGDLAWPAFERAFRQYGLPEVLRTDNGSPFASSRALAGLSHLSVRWLKLGIGVERTEPAHPEQNGQHEQMHRILKAETTRPPAADSFSQQESFDRFRREYNEDRPHEALGQRPPSELYQASPRPYPERLPPPDYPGHYEVRSVHPGGEIKWQGRYLFLSEALGGERVGLEEYDDGLWAVYFARHRLARIDERERKLYG